MRVESPGAREVLNDVADRLVNGDLVGRASALYLACQHFADFGDDVVVADEAGFLCVEKFCALAQDAFTTVCNEARADDEISVDFSRAGIAGPDEVHVRTGLNPRSFEDGLAGAGDGADDVGVCGGLFCGCDSRYGKVELGLILSGEGVCFLEGTSPDDGAREVTDFGDGAEVRQRLLTGAEDGQAMSIGQCESVGGDGACGSGANGGDLTAVNDADGSA